jgi:hypothetical protein
MFNKVKFYCYVISSIFFLPFVFYFFVINCGREVIGLFSGGDVVYFNWKSLPILVCMPMVVLFEILLISCLFTKDKKVHPKIMSFVNKSGVFISVVFFISVFSGPLIAIFFAFSSYHACASAGIFSGVYYVHDKSRCFNLTHVVPWDDNHQDRNSNISK